MLQLYVILHYFAALYFPFAPLYATYSILLYLGTAYVVWLSPSVVVVSKAYPGNTCT